MANKEKDFEQEAKQENSETSTETDQAESDTGKNGKQSSKQENSGTNTEADQVESDTGKVEEQSSEQETIATLQKSLEEKEDAYLRLQAELANIQKRNRKEREEAAKFQSQSLAKELIPVIDNLERALSIEVTDKQGENLKAGLEMVMESLRLALKNEGIEVIDPINEQFDPNYHQAVQTVPVEEGQESETVVMVHQKGYDLHGRVLRPAMVAVAQ